MIFAQVEHSNTVRQFNRFCIHSTLVDIILKYFRLTITQGAIKVPFTLESLPAAQNWELAIPRIPLKTILNPRL